MGQYGFIENTRVRTRRRSVRLRGIWAQTMGAYLGASSPVQGEFTGALVYFEKTPKGEKKPIDGTFKVVSYDHQSGDIVLLPHWDDYNHVLSQIKGNFGSWLLGLGVSETDSGIKFNMKIPGDYLRFWDDDFNGQNVIEFSMKDPEDIKWLQEFLWDNNYAEKEPTGTWSADTTQAMKWFQEEMEIPVTGVFDERTAEAMFKNLFLKAEKQQESKPRVGPIKLKEQKKEAPPAGKKRFPTRKVLMWGAGVGAVGLLGYGIYSYMEEGAGAPPVM
jgi:hypothetical protein